jgi:hypothetical protein
MAKKEQELPRDPWPFEEVIVNGFRMLRLKPGHKGFSFVKPKRRKRPNR